jgi:CubicO group peptidase (beta-lactamase class C family)
MKLLLTAWLLLAGLWGAAQTPARTKALAALLKKTQVPGLQLVYGKGTDRVAYNLGVRKSGTTQAVGANTVFQAASLGKVVLAYVALRLHDRGLLALDKPLVAYHAYPRLAGQAGADKITARMVLAHSSGLPNWAEHPLGASWKTSALRLKYAPDSCWNYSGEGYVLLQKTLEQLTGKPWEVLAHEEVFGPLGMKSSSYVWREQFAARACFGHDKAGKATEVKQFAEANAGFSLLTTAADYHRFVQALVLGQGLKPATAQLLRTPANAANRCGTPASAADPAIAWACGLGLAATSRGPAQWHWGDNDDFQSFFMTLPGTRESILFLTNSANGLAMTDEILRLFFGPGQYWTMQWLAAGR